MKLLWIRRDSTHWPGAADLRTRVFVGEQNVPPELELDEYDATADHLVALDDDGVVRGTLRLLPYGEGDVKIGRVAVDAALRGTGLGLALMREAFAEARRRNCGAAHLGSQVTVVGFYEKLGFTAFGDVFDDAGIPHRHMVLLLDASGEIREGESS
ncbi:MAG: GNAT family N-acetyltransferase [Deltaproteobacteria bacterium]|nr:GNAT family N-acetyltransferase [Deltaproteobacteria bacterium]